MTIARQRATNARSAPIWRSPATPRAAMLTTNPFDDDKLREECGVFGVSGAADSAAALVALGLHALQHRGQEAAGITSFDGAHFHTHRAMGHVAGNFDKDDVIRALPGNVRSEEHTSELQSLMRNSYAGFCLKKKN